MITITDHSHNRGKQNPGSLLLLAWICTPHSKHLNKLEWSWCELNGIESVTPHYPFVIFRSLSSPAAIIPWTCTIMGCCCHVPSTVSVAWSLCAAQWRLSWRRMTQRQRRTIQTSGGEELRQTILITGAPTHRRARTHTHTRTVLLQLSEMLFFNVE